eukprot:gene11276-15128_t
MLRRLHFPTKRLQTSLCSSGTIIYSNSCDLYRQLKGFKNKNNVKDRLFQYRQLHDFSQKEVGESERIVKIALIGNIVITVAKCTAYVITGSSAMLSETIHSLVDCGNQSLLLIGLRGADSAPDKYHQYGYGKSVYFWSLVSALGTFWFGAGISGWNSIGSLINPVLAIDNLGFELWSVLGISFIVDGWVLSQTVKSIMKSKPSNLTLYQHCLKIRDPTTAAVLMEDSAALVGILIAVGGIGATQLTHMPIFDSLAGFGIAGILGSMGVYLARLNQQYLLGQAVDSDIVVGIRKILLARASIEEVHSEQSQWIGPNTFSYKAEVDFDGTYIAAKLLKRYQAEFVTTKNLSVEEVQLLLAWYAEDVMRTVEQEVKELEADIRKQYPQALYIELEPDSKKSEQLKLQTYAIDDGKETSLKKIEIETINQFQRSFKRKSKKDTHKEII